MPSTITRIADAVTAELNASAWSVMFAARCAYRPRFEVRELSDVQVSVAPRAVVVEAGSRAAASYQYQIDVAIQQKLLDESAEEMDALLGLADEFVRYFHSRRLQAMQDAVCVKVEHNPIYAIEHLEELRCFTSVVTLTFQLTASE